MQAAVLEKLHNDMEAANAVRGSSGGLGFETGKASKKVKVDSAASKALAKERTGGSSREFQSTTAGAVAAGHWDPWARPVEFKLKQVNRTAGGLASMFVKGETMGGTLGMGKSGANGGEEKPSKDGGKKRAREEEDIGDLGGAAGKKNKKGKKGVQEPASSQDGAEGAAAELAADFNWRREIRVALKGSGSLELKKLRCAVCERYKEHRQGRATGEELAQARRKLKRKLKSIDCVLVSGGEVRWVSDDKAAAGGEQACGMTEGKGKVAKGKDGIGKKETSGKVGGEQKSSKDKSAEGSEKKKKTKSKKEKGDKNL